MVQAQKDTQVYMEMSRRVIDYNMMDERMRKCLRDSKMVRGTLDTSDHYLGMAELTAEMKWVRIDAEIKKEELVEW